MYEIICNGTTRKRQADRERTRPIYVAFAFISPLTQVLGCFFPYALYEPYSFRLNFLLFCPIQLFGVQFRFFASLNITYSNFSFIFMHTNSNQNNGMRKKTLMNNTRSVIIGLGIVFLCDVNIRSFLQFRIRLLACQPVCLFICLFYYCAWYKMC